MRIEQPPREDCVQRRGIRKEHAFALICTCREAGTNVVLGPCKVELQVFHFGKLQLCRVNTTQNLHRSNLVRMLQVARVPQLPLSFRCVNIRR